MLRLEHRTLVVVTLGLFIPSQALAYVDPGTSGLISQVLYVMFYGALAVFFYFLRYIKSSIARAKTFLVGLFGRNP